MVHTWPAGTWKDVQHHQLLGKCKSKLQWDQFIFARMTVIKKKKLEMLMRGWRKWNPCAFWKDCKLIQQIWKSTAIPQKINNDLVTLLLSIETVMPFNHLILCHPLLLLPSIFLSIRVFSNELVLRIRWPKYWIFSISPSNKYLGLISFRIDCVDCLTPWWSHFQRNTTKHPEAHTKKLVCFSSQGLVNGSQQYTASWPPVLP